MFYLIGQLATDHVMFETQYHQLETDHMTSQYSVIGYYLMVIVQMNIYKLATHIVNIWIHQIVWFKQRQPSSIERCRLKLKNENAVYVHVYFQS